MFEFGFKTFASTHALWFLFYFADPRQWTEEHVIYWLNWATKEFSLECMNIEPFSKMRGRDMIALGREGFLAIAPPFTGDILWEHLEILQKGKKQRAVLFIWRVIFNIIHEWSL